MHSRLLPAVLLSSVREKGEARGVGTVGALSIAASHAHGTAQLATYTHRPVADPIPLPSLYIPDAGM
jgi:hypothetical protein